MPRAHLITALCTSDHCFGPQPITALGTSFAASCTSDHCRAHLIIALCTSDHCLGCSRSLPCAHRSLPCARPSVPGDLIALRTVDHCPGPQPITALGTSFAASCTSSHCRAHLIIAWCTSDHCLGRSRSLPCAHRSLPRARPSVPGDLISALCTSDHCPGPQPITAWAHRSLPRALPATAGHI